MEKSIFDAKIILISDHKDKLISCWEAIRSLIYPFKKFDAYFPCLADGFLHIINSPFPYSMGLLRELEAKIEELEDTDTTLVLDLDRD